ncbi:hypothetical protein RHGRI_001382 [Rhododendron griersonianum]|uniref:Uncharacterized protein n=1 Tax=Rhododendron griersonianum TaxID=479676 RepID=A0AAV6LLA6_9ERIC|nr:hypothetical protein RHGRI_001382 [Rhododendron griersonianum]
MAVYNGTPLAKAFLKYINVVPSTPNNIAESSETFSNDGFGNIEPSDGEKEVEQPVPVAAIPLLAIPLSTIFRRKKHTRTLVSISEEPSKNLSSPKRRKTLIADSDEDIVSYPRAGRSPSQEILAVEPITEENHDTMVDLNQVGNPEGSSDPLTTETSNVGNPANSPPAVSETLTSQSIHASTEISPPLVGTSIPELDEPPVLEEIPPLETHSSDVITHMVVENTMPSEFELCCQALALLKPNSLDLTQRLQHGTSNIRSDFPCIQDLFQERKALQMVEEDMENLHSQALSNRNSHREDVLRL